MAAQHNMELKKILGFTTNDRNSFLCQPGTGNLIYIAGCVVVIYNPKTKSQQHLIVEFSKQSITTLAITDDGRYLAAANCCHSDKASIFIWDLHNLTLLGELNGHRFEIACMSFSANNEILVSVGGQLDQMMCLWDWQRGLKLASHKLATRIRAVSFSADSSYFVAVGEACVKFWYIQLLSSPSNTATTTTTASPAFSTSSRGSSGHKAVSMTLSSRSATLGEQKRNSFCDVKCGRGLMAGSTFCITRSGLLCELNSKRLLHKWVDLRTTSAHCLTISESLLVIGCSNGICRCFNSTELRFLKNLPRPHVLGADSSTGKQTSKKGNNYPNVISVGLYESAKSGETNVTCVYNDRSIYTWDLSDSQRVVKKYSALYHSSCIWGIDMYPSTTTSGRSYLAGDYNSSLVPPGSFITCSSDDTLRIWDLKLAENLNQSNDALLLDSNGTREKPVAKERSKIIFTDSSYKFLCDADGSNGRSGEDPGKLSELEQNYDTNEGLRCLRISPNGKHLAVGSRSGAIRVFDFENEAAEVKSIAAHDAEVLCIEYSDPKTFDGFSYLASSSRDKLIHIFDAANDYNFLQTIDDHSSSITALRFVNNRARDRLQLISCGADQKIIFRDAIKQGSAEAPVLSFSADQLIEGKQTFYDMEVDCESSCLMIACQDGMIRLFNVAQVKYQSSFRGSSTNEGTLIKIALDPSCTFLATSSTDKSINIYDYQRGERIASLTSGLSDLVTDLKFSQDGRHLVACSGDGCIFVWSSPAEIANAVTGNLGCFMTDQQQRQHEQQQHYAPTLGSKSKTTTTTTSNSASRLKSLPDWAKQQLLEENKRAGSGSAGEGHSSEEPIYEDLLAPGESRYQVQSANHLDNKDELVNYAQENVFDEQPVRQRRFERNQRSSNGTASNRYADNSGLVSSMAKYFQSRENLDKISSREKYVIDSLALKDEAAGLAPANGASLSGQFNTKQSQETTSKPASSSNQSDLRAEHSSDEDELDRGPPHTQLARQQFTASATNLSARVRQAISPKPAMQRHNARLNSSKSLVSGRPKQALRSASCDRGLPTEPKQEEKTDAGQVKSIYCEKLDLTKLSPTTVALTQELCQYVVEELQAISRYATRLHQRVQASGNRSLGNLLARGVQNSMDVLSIVPARSSHQAHQFQSQVNLSPASMVSRRSKMAAQQQARRPLGSGSVLGTLRVGSPRPGSVSPARAQQQQPGVASAKTLDTRTHAKAQECAPKLTSGDKQRNLNIDQVLEAYSDRLFRMVQERMVEQQQQQQQAAASPTQQQQQQQSNGTADLLMRQSS